MLAGTEILMLSVLSAASIAVAAGTPAPSLGKFLAVVQCNTEVTEATCPWLEGHKRPTGVKF